MGSLYQAYQSIYYNEQELREEVAEFCNEFFFDTEEETEYFVEELFKDEDIVLEFFDDVLEFSSEFQLNEDTYITEIRSALIKHGLKFGQGLLKKATPAVRGMSAKTLTKQGIQAGGLTQKGALLAKTNKPALATQTAAIQTSRAARQAGIPKTQEPNKFLNMLQQKRASRGLPAAGETTAGTAKAKGERGWLRHRVAVDQANTVATAFMKSLEAQAKAAQKVQKVSAASSKLATAAKGTKNIGPAIPMGGAKPNTGAGLIGTTDVLTDIGKVSKKYGMDAPAPKPAWGGKLGDVWDDTRLVKKPNVKVQAAKPAPEPQKALSAAPERPALPGGTTPGAGRKDFASSAGVRSSGAKMGPDGVKGTQLPGYTAASKQTVDVGATTVSSSRTKTDRVREVVRNAGKNKGAVGVALASAAGAYGLSKVALDSGNKKTVDTTDYETKVKGDPTYYADKDPEVLKGKPAPAKPNPVPAKPAPAPAKPKPAPAPAKPKPAPAPAKPKPAPAKPAPAKPAPAKPSGSKGSPSPVPTPAKPSGSKGSPSPVPTPAKPSGSKGSPSPVPSGKETPKQTGTKKKMTKVDREVKELMGMRVASLERQGKKSEAKTLRDKISKRYSGYED